MAARVARDPGEAGVHSRPFEELEEEGAESQLSLGWSTGLWYEINGLQEIRGGRLRGQVNRVTESSGVPIEPRESGYGIGVYGTMMRDSSRFRSERLGIGCEEFYVAS